MARARNIKPGFFTNDELVSLSFETRLLFIGLWTIADREGRLLDRPNKIKMEIFPGDNVDCKECLASLERSGFIRRYSKEDNRYIQILNWFKHQKPHIKEAPSSIPPDHGPAPEIPEQAPEENGPAPEIPEQAGLIPDCLNLIPDCLQNHRLSPPEWLNESAWNNFLQFRKGTKFTRHAQNLAIKKLDELRRKGHDPTAVIETSILNGWKGLFEPKANHAKPQKFNIAVEAVERLKRSGFLAGSPDDEVHEPLRGEVYEHDPKH